VHRRSPSSPACRGRATDRGPAVHRARAVVRRIRAVASAAVLPVTATGDVPPAAGVAAGRAVRRTAATGATLAGTGRAGTGRADIRDGGRAGAAGGALAGPVDGGGPAGARGGVRVGAGAPVGGGRVGAGASAAGGRAGARGGVRAGAGARVGAGQAGACRPVSPRRWRR
jgi:hypothetical protein